MEPPKLQHRRRRRRCWARTVVLAAVEEAQILEAMIDVVGVLLGV